MGKRGPPPKGEYVGQTAVISTRITPELREKLEDAVASSETKTTLSREIEHRLRRTFIEDSQINEAFGSRHNYALMRTISMVLEIWHNPADPLADWREDPIAYDLMCQKIDGVLKAMRPEGEGRKLSDLEQVLADASAREHPALVLQEVQSASSAYPLKGSQQARRLSSIKNDLGSLIDRPQIFAGTAEQIRAEADLSEEKRGPVSKRTKPKGPRE